MATRGAGGGGGGGDARCSRADCLALREELEILRGDHADLERENETLHDRVATLESELSSVSARLRSDAATASEQLATKDAQLQALGDAVAALEAQLKQSNAARQQQQQATANTTTDATSTTATATATASRPSDRELEEECAALRGKNAALETALRETRSALARETSASAHAQQAVARIQQESKDKRDELYEALKENELLRQERSELHTALQKISEVALDYEATIKGLHDQQREYVASLDEQTVEIAQLQLKLEQQERDNETLASKLVEMDARESDVDAIVRELRTKSDMERVVWRNEMEALRRNAQQLEEKLQQQQQQQSQQQPPQQRHTTVDEKMKTKATSSDREDVAALERQLEMLEELRLQDKAALEEQRETIAQLQSDLATLSEHVADQQHTQQSTSDARTHTATLQHENEALQRRLKEQRDVVRALELRQTQLERELVDAQTWNAKYEAGAGLEDVLAFQKKLRRELETQQRQNQRLREQLNAQTEAAGRLHAAFERLKRDAGYPPEFAYDDLAVETQLQGELAVQQAVMAQMELQLQELESERVRLLQRLREQAKRVGGSLFESLGLTTEQWQQVEEFIDRVKRTPEVATRWLHETTAATTVALGAEKKEEKKTEEDDGGAAEDERRRLRQEVERLRRELELATQRRGTGEREDAPPTASSSSFVSVATMTTPLNTETTGTSPSPTLRSPTSSSKAAPAPSSSTEPATASSSPSLSPEDLAQAIAHALETRLALRSTATATTTTISKEASTPSPTPTPSASSAASAAMAPSLLFASEDAMAQQLDVLQELQLLLDDYATLEAQNATLRERLERHDRALQSALDQQRVAYEHVFHAKDAHAQDKRRWAVAMEELRTQLLELQRRAEQREREERSSTPHETTTTTSVTRQLATLEVEHAALQREHRVLRQELQLSTQHATRLEREWLDMERVLKCRVLYLESWRRGALDRLQRLERALHDSVPRRRRPTDEREANEKEQETTTRQRETTLALREALADCHARYLALLPLPAELSRLQHEHALLVAMTSSSASAAAVETTATQRIEALEKELAAATARVKELESSRVDTLITASLGLDRETSSSSATSDREETELLRTENALLLERVAEVEQQYESLARECERYEDVAALAASQAHALTQRLHAATTADDDREQQLRTLQRASEDHAIVAQLQLQLAHVTSTYQLFARRYDDAVDAQQRATLRQQQLEMALELQAKDASARDEQQRERVATLERAVACVRERDWSSRNAAWDAFKRRLDALEREMVAAQERRRALEQELQDKQLSLAMAATERGDGGGGDREVVGRLQRRIDALETRERVLLGQLEAATASGGSSSSSNRSSKERESLRRELAESKTLNQELLRQLETQRQRVTELLAAQAELETQRRHALREKEDAQLELQALRSQFYVGSNNQQPEQQQQSPETAPSSPLMRRKVGMYEQDQAALQQAAQATIASLKLLVDEKNAALSAYERQARERQQEASAAKAADRRAAAALHKQLYDENQRMIAELRDAMATIRELEASGKDQRALQAAEQRHETALREWKKAEVALETARQRTRELEAALGALQAERDLAEARAGEALEEIVLLQQKAEDAAAERQRVETALATAKRELRGREDKMQLLRDALIKLKEEFLKAEDRHAMALVKAQQQLQQMEMKQTREKNETRRDGKSESEERLRAQVTLLQEKLALVKASETRLRRQLGTSSAGRKSKRDAEEKEEEKKEEAEQHVVVALKSEVERLKAALKDRVVGDARVVEELEKKLRVLTAQNLALREAAAPSRREAEKKGAAAAAEGEENREDAHADALHRRKTTAAWEAEKRMQRRVDALTLRLKEKQSELDRRAAEGDALRSRVEQLERQLAELQRAATAARAAMQQPSTTAGGAGAAPVSRKDERSAVSPAAGGAAGGASAAAGELEDLRRQNAFLQETLTLKRQEWEQTLLAQTDKYETQLERLRTRLVRRQGAAMTGNDADDVDVDGHDESALVREEHAFLVAEELREELSTKSEELREKERALVERDARLLDVELELESLRVEYQRLQRKAATSASGGSSSSASGGGGAGRAGATTGDRARGGGRVLKSTAQERLELEEVIENMKKVIEKLRSENERLRRHATSALTPEKLETLRRKLRETRETLQTAEHEVDALRRENAELKQEKLRLQQRVRELSSHRRKSQQHDAAHEDVSRLLEDKQRELRELQDVVSKKDAMIHELHEQLLSTAGVQDSEQGAEQTRKKMEALERENAQLREELGAFDQDFFEEIEDLKYKYAQAVRAKQRLETRLQLLEEEPRTGSRSGSFGGSNSTT